MGCYKFFMSSIDEFMPVIQIQFILLQKKLHLLQVLFSHLRDNHIPDEVHLTQVILHRPLEK